MDSEASLAQRRRELRVAWAALLLAAAGWLMLLLSRPGAPLAPRSMRPQWETLHVSGARALLFGETLDLNRASPEQLAVLPGIGPARAQAIVRERGRRPFERVEELQAVPGIGPRTLEAVADWVHVATPLPGR